MPQLTNPIPLVCTAILAARVLYIGAHDLAAVSDSTIANVSVGIASAVGAILLGCVIRDY